MPRARSPERDLAYQLWLDSGKTRKLKDIAAEIGASESLVRKWKNQDKWEDGPPRKGNVTKPPKGNVTKAPKGSVTKKIKSNVTEEEARRAADKVIDNTELTDKQQLFCIYFSKSLNATSSYQKAYGCDYSVALVNGSRLLKNARIADEIRRLKRERYAQAFLEPSDIFQKFMDIAFTDISDLLSWGREEAPVMGPFGPITETDPETGDKIPLTKEVNVVRFKDSNRIDTSLISEVKQGRDGVSIKLPDRMKALEWLADHMDLATPEQRARTEKLIAETDRLRSGLGTEDDDMVLQFIRGMHDDQADG